MNKIKVIKKGAVGESGNRQVKAVEEKSPSESKGREAIKTVESWIAEWRCRTEIETRRALSELNSLKLRNSN